MAQHRVVLLPGDGIGPEITAVARKLLEVVSQRHGFELSFEEQPIGGSAIASALRALAPWEADGGGVGVKHTTFWSTPDANTRLSSAEAVRARTSA